MFQSHWQTKNLLWRLPLTCPHSINPRKQSEFSPSTLSTQQIKPQVAKSQFSLKLRTGLKADLLISTTTQLTTSLNRNWKVFGLNTKTEGCKKREGMRRLNKFWTNGPRLARVSRLKFNVKKNTLTSPPILRRHAASCELIGKARTSIQMMIRHSKTLPLMRVNLKQEKGLKEQTELIPCQTSGTNLTHL